ncbi:MAG: hypothetical protein DYG98_05585 [Haliscomenobacteraceae bacterium CHB4]|nr:hypothetical protein [Haliscomenobacteraceae bacterium CHB4]
MKKTIFFSAFGALLLLFCMFSCQRENTFAPAVSNQENQQVTGRSHCDDINIVGGNGLGLCGVPAGPGTSSCDLCSSLSNDITIVGSPAVYTLDGQDRFVLYNFGSTNVTVTVYFNCDATAVNITVPADSKVFCEILDDANGCCYASVLPPC